jgi:TfoX/Sxy family transcriptional regulator of competence genes
MASKQDVVDEIINSMSGAGEVASRKMFGEYAIYLGDRVVGLVCDDQLFMKVTPGSAALAKEDIKAPPYPGAKPYFVVSGDYWDDRDYLAALAQAVARDVPPPKKRRKQ